MNGQDTLQSVEHPHYQGHASALRVQVTSVRSAPTIKKANDVSFGEDVERRPFQYFGWETQTSAVAVRAGMEVIRKFKIGQERWLSG